MITRRISDDPGGWSDQLLEAHAQRWCRDKQCFDENHWIPGFAYQLEGAAAAIVKLSSLMNYPNPEHASWSAADLRREASAMRAATPNLEDYVAQEGLEVES